MPQLVRVGLRALPAKSEFDIYEKAQLPEQLCFWIYLTYSMTTRRLGSEPTE